MSTNNGYAPGLEGIVAAETELSHVDGLKGELIIAGFPLARLAANATFEEAVFLLWNGRLPTQIELADLKQELAELRPLPIATVDLLHEATKAEPTPWTPCAWPPPRWIWAAAAPIRSPPPK